jgi:16S rRNA (guanine527-N7)-methyltransferase
MPGELQPLGRAFFPLISAVAGGLRAALADEQVERIAAWFDLVALWNAKIDLTAARSAEELSDLMLADALVLARHERPRATILDVGSGAGAPGMALYLARPDLALTLVEPVQKRVAFLRTVAGRVGVSSPQGGAVRVVRGRGDDWVGKQPPFDCAVARATLAPVEWLKLGMRLVGSAGAVWVLLAREPPPVLPGLRIDVDESYRWPLTGVARRALRYVSVAP